VSGVATYGSWEQFYATEVFVPEGSFQVGALQPELPTRDFWPARLALLGGWGPRLSKEGLRSRICIAQSASKAQTVTACNCPHETILGSEQ
jgi:hypothetical protein